MGAVYRGRNRETGEFHAIKSLLDNFSDSEHFRNRFESEIRALIKLDHPNIVRIISFGQEMGTMYFAMELVEGASLFQLQKKGYRFDWREILSITRQVAKGLRHAHDRGIVHRDLKPGNLLMPINQLDEHGEVKLTDFGIAKRFGTSQNTGENLIGTMDFMSPEQAKGQPATARSDLYSLGTVLYTLMAGKPPFSSNSFEESLRRLTRVPAPPIGTILPNIPTQVDLLLQKLMAKDPEKRIPTAQALLFKLDEIEQDLLETSQAKTRQVPQGKPQDETFEIVQPSDEATYRDTERADRQSDPRIKKGGSLISDPTCLPNKLPHANDTLASNVRLPNEDSVQTKRMMDFHNTVLDQLRTEDFRDVPADSARGLWWLALAFFGVVGLLVWGLFQASRPKAADVLFAKLETSSGNPAQIVEVTNEFLTHYPDDPRAEYVKSRQTDAQQERRFGGLLNKLNARKLLTNENRLSEIEKQLVEVFNEYGPNKNVAAAKMAALVTVHKANQELTESDQLCLEAAEYYHKKFKAEARDQLLTKLRFIRRMVDANKIEMDPRKKATQYQSLLELYQDENWDDSPEGQNAAELMKFVKEQVKE
jgi:serine/threonine-protein kinase